MPWRPGESGNVRGRPPRDRELKYLAACYRGCSPAKVTKIVKRLAERAEGGDNAACRILFGCLMGSLRQTIELTSGAENVLRSVVQRSRPAGSFPESLTSNRVAIAVKEPRNMVAVHGVRRRNHTPWTCLRRASRENVVRGLTARGKVECRPRDGLEPIPARTERWCDPAGRRLRSPSRSVRTSGGLFRSASLG